jgi:hypothetical protein
MSAATAIVSRSRPRSTTIVPPVSTLETPVRPERAKIRGTSPTRDGRRLLKRRPTLIAFALSQVDTRSRSTNRCRQRIARTTRVRYVRRSVGTSQTQLASSRLDHTSSRDTCLRASHRQTPETRAPTITSTLRPAVPERLVRALPPCDSTRDTEGSVDPADMSTESLDTVPAGPPFASRVRAR